MATNPAVDSFVDRAPAWRDEMHALRGVLHECGLDETVKWGKPCYVHDGRNIAILQPMREFLAMMFFKGSLLSDPASVLRDQGPNSRSARRLEFVSVADVTDLAATVREYVAEAIRVERSGRSVPPAPSVELAEELRHRLDDDPVLRAAFDALTPGRRREYHLYVSGARQAATRRSRVDACVPKILAGRGLRDR